MQLYDERNRRRLTRSHVDACPSSTLQHTYSTTTDPTGTADIKEWEEEEVVRLVETLALGSAGKSTQKIYVAKWNTWVNERAAQGKGPWLHVLDDPDKALNERLALMATRCFVHNSQQSTVRRYLATSNFSHKMFAGWELPTSHCIIGAVGQGIDTRRSQLDCS